MKNYNTKLFLVSITLVLLIFEKSFAQVGTIAQVSPGRSPDAAALGKYVEMPLGNYSGVPQISIPLFEVKNKEASLPMSISYHASGIKVSELPGSLGAGWSLNAGGVITRIVRGYPDDHNNWELGDIENESIRRRLKSAEKRGFHLEFNYNEQFDITSSVPGVVKEGADPHTKVDTEYDTFYFNFGGNTGEFTFNNEGTPMLLSGNNNLKIEYNNRKFKIIDPLGIIYSFDAVEQDMDTRYGHDDYGLPYTTSWFLTRVYSPTTNSEINLSYKTLANPVLYDGTELWQTALMNNIFRVKLKDETITDSPLENSDCTNFNSFSSSSIPSREGNGVVLDEINWDQNKIKFYGTTNRLDVYKYKIDSIRVISGNELIKSIKFQYGYFNAQAALRKSKKLRLEQLTVNDARHSFDYIESKDGFGFPALDNTSVDHWGYFNASGGSGYPYYKIYDTEYAKNESIPAMSTAYKNPDAKYAEIGTLRSITFPTGGKAIYTYEGNDFNFAPFAFPNIESDPYNQLKFQTTENHSNSIIYPNTGDATSRFRITENQTVKLTASLGLLHMDYYEYYENVLNGGYQQGPNYATLQIAKVGTGGINLYHEISPRDLIGDPGSQSEFEVVQDIEKLGVKNISMDVYLEAGEYQISCFTNGYGLFSTASVTTKSNYMNNGGTYYAGGLRIKKVEFLAGAGPEKSYEKSYFYKTEDGKSSGVLESPFANVSRSYYFGELKPLSGGRFKQSKCSFYNIYPNPIIPLGNSKGGIIGYSRVTEKMKDSSSIVRYFTNGTEGGMSDRFLENSTLGTRVRILVDNSWQRGMERRIDYFNADNNKVKSDFKKYDFVEDKSQESVSLTLDDIDFGGSGELYSNKYYIKRHKRDVLLRQDSTVLYYPVGNTEAITKYDYNTSKHPYVSKITNINSSGNQTITALRYPQDFEPGISPSDTIARGIQVLLNNHVVAPVIERTIQKSNIGGGNLRTVASELNIFKDTTPVPHVIYELETTNPITDFSPLVVSNGSSLIDNRYEKRIIFSKYDGFGNVVEQLKDGGVKEVLIWGYNHKFIVAKINRSDYNTVIAMIDMNIVNNPVSSTALQTELNKVRTGLLGSNPNAEVITYTYSDLKGMTSMTDPKGMTTYYEYDSFQRLKHIKDQNGNIIKSYDYHYKP